MSAWGRPEPVAFDRPVETDDGSGGKAKDWEEAHRTAAECRYLRGGEEVIAARLTGRQPLIARVRRTAGSAEIAPEWRMRQLRGATIFNVRAVVPTEDGYHLEVLCETGVAV